MARRSRIGGILVGERGTAVVMVSLLMVVLLGSAALAVDVGLLYVTRGKLQNIADAAALAGVMDLPDASYARTTAIGVAVSNGVSEADTFVTTPYDGNETKVEVVCVQAVPHAFARALGLVETEVSARAIAQKVTHSGYAIFSGGTTELILNGGGITVVGGIHANSDFKANGEDIVVNGTVEAVGRITVDDPSGIPDRVSGVDSIPLSDYVRSIGLDPDLVAAELASAITYYGDRQISSNPGRNIYVKGKALLNTSGLRVDGSTIADGDIYIDAENLTLNCPLIYSKSGKIEIKKGNVTITGTLYSPISDIIINNSGYPVVVNGQIVGGFVRLNGPGITIDATNSSGSSSTARLIR